MLQALKALVGNRNPLRLGYHWARAFIAAILYGFPARSLTVIGVTGTDGKTTTVGMIAQILEQSGVKTGALSTAFFRVHGRTEWNLTRLTSPSPFVVQKFLRKMVSEGCTHAVLEYSSHGLVQHRTAFTWPAVAAITNLSEEHLDYHGSMEQYALDKKRLFQLLAGKGVKVLNGRDRTFQLYKDVPTERTYVYGRSDFASAYCCWITNEKAGSTHCSATLHTNVDASVHEIQIEVPGLFNLENALCALCCCNAVGISFAKGTEALRSFQPAPGRMEKIDAGQDFNVYVDFTVSPNAFTQTLTSLRSTMIEGGKLIVLTGSCGDRMREKRPQIGAICSELADIVVLTEDETYTEPTEKILDEVWAGIDQQKTEAHKILDRKEAIQFALAQAKTGDVVLLCGMGSYPVRQTENGLVDWNEQEITREILRTM